MKSGFATWLAWGVLAVALLFLGLHLLGDNNLEVGRGAGVSTSTRSPPYEGGLMTIKETTIGQTKLLALVEMRGSAVVERQSVFAELRNCQIVGNGA